MFLQRYVHLPTDGSFRGDLWLQSDYKLRKEGTGEVRRGQEGGRNAIPSATFMVGEEFVVFMTDVF